MKILAFVSARPGMGTTTLLYNLAATFQELGLKVLLVDGDPQAALSERVLGAPVDHQVLWNKEPWGPLSSSLSGLLPSVHANGANLAAPAPLHVDGLAVLTGGWNLPDLEDRFAEEWLHLSRPGDASPVEVPLTLRVSQAIHAAAEAVQADLVLVNASPYYTAISRALVVGADAVILTIAPGWLSFLKLADAQDRVVASLACWSSAGLAPSPPHPPLGFVYIPGLAARTAPWQLPEDSRPRLELGTCHLSPSLLDLSLEAKKPEILLSPADGALGSLADAVRQMRREFEALARTLATRAEIELP